MKKPSRWIVDGADLSRRSILRVGALSFMGMNLNRFLRLEPLMASSGSGQPGKAQACILLWLNGGPSHIDMWDPKPNSSFQSISTNVPGIQISELLPRSAKHMDKLSIIRSMHTEENNHGMGHHYVMTGHRPNPSMKFPAFSSIITKEMGPRNSVPPNIIVPEIHPGYRNYYKAHFLGAQYDPMEIPDPNNQDFEVPDLSLPASLTVERMESRRAFLGVVDQLYRQNVETAEHASMDAFRTQALEHDSVAGRPRGLRSFHRVRGNQGCLRSQYLWPKCPDCAPHGGGREPLRDRSRSQPAGNRSRLGHALRQ